MAPYLTLMTEDATQRRYPLREVFNGLRSIVRGGLQWRLMPHDLPPWPVVYQRARRRLLRGHRPRPAAAAAAGRRARSGADGGGPGGAHAAVDARGRRPSRPRRAQAQEGLQGPRRRRHPEPPARPPRHAGRRPGAGAGRRAGQSDAGGDRADGGGGLRRPGPHRRGGRRRRRRPRQLAGDHQAARGQARLRAAARRWVVERSFAWAGRFRRLARDYERLHTTLEGFHFFVALRCWPCRRPGRSCGCSESA